jgi:hypothetical protein
MRTPHHVRSFIRLIGVSLAVTVAVGGVTFAALQSQQAKLTGNTIQTAVANLQISSDGVTYSNSQTGFAFANLIPGGPATPATGYTFFLKNAGGTPLALKLAASSAPGNPNGVDLTKVHVILTPASGGQPESFTLQSLLDNAATGGDALTSPAALFSGNSQQFSIQVVMDSDAVAGSSAIINNLDLSFTGTAVN